MKKDEVRLPDDIASFSEEKKKEVARSLINTTHLNNQRIADATHLKVKQVASMRLRMAGKTPSIGENLASAAPVPEPSPEQVPEQPDEQAPEQTNVTSFSAPVRPGAPASPKGKELTLVHLESEIKDTRSYMQGVDAKISALLGAVKSGQFFKAPGSPDVEEKVIQTSFDTFPLKLDVDTYLWALFSAWKQQQNMDASENGLPQYQKDFAGFVVDCIYEWFEKRGIDFTYTQTRNIMTPRMAQGRR